ncbi:Mannitol 2-dehydrogenase [Halioglobus japonicus]|nr:Mannitol 2-dehydrogenase [Halioglobus japonicus]
MKLSTEYLVELQHQQTIATPRYDRKNTGIGIVHIGPGAFHRAHQAVYTENAMNQSGGDWGICGVSLRSSAARDVLSTQDYLYTLAIRDTTPRYQIIGAIQEILVAGEQSEAILKRLTADTTKIVSLTITEKGYCLNAQGTLDLEHPDIAADLRTPRQPQSAIGFLVEGMRLRRDTGTAAFTVLSCDNVSGNGDKLQRSVLDYALLIDKGLADWITDNVAFPNSMVDSITPKTEDYTIASVSTAIGAQDNWPVQREEFTQWVIEDNWSGDRPNWEDVGVVFTDDVEGFEKAKLRLLNCLHSTLAYSGLLDGFKTVYEVTSDPRFQQFITDLSHNEIIGSFNAPTQLDIKTYSREIITRFLNPEIQHQLAQIAWDGSQKIQMRILPIIRDNLRLARPTGGLCLALACWFEFICRALKTGREIVDPLAAEFSQLAVLQDDDTSKVVSGFLSITSIFGDDLINNPQITAQLAQSLHILRSRTEAGKPVADILNRSNPHRFDELLTQTVEGWQWHLPEKFNIAYACVRRHIEQNHGEKTALVIEDDQLGSSELSYRTLDSLSGQFVHALGQLGISCGDRVLIRLPNSVDYPVSFFGCLKYGAVAVPTSTLLSTPEVAYLAKDSGAKVLVTHKSMWSELRPIVDENSDLETILLAGPGEMPDDIDCPGIQVLDLQTLLAGSPVDDTIVTSSPDDPAYLVYTSGTTGYPKGVLHAHRSLLGRQPASHFWFDFKEGDRILHSGKFNWTYVLGTGLMDPLCHGHTVVVHEGKSDASVWMRLIKKHDCTIFIGVPTIYRQILQKTESTGADVPSLRHCMSAGEHLSDEMLFLWRERFGMDIYEAIGMSECSYYISQNTERPIRPGAAGFIQPGHEVELLDEHRQPVKAGEEGMIAIKDSDPGLFLGYWQLPQETAKSRSGGYFLTGDYARIDEDGYIWFVGRKDDIINTFGYRVSPHEIERVIKTHPGVSDCVALGEMVEKDKILVSVCVIANPDATVTAQDILDFGNDKLARYKAPKRVHFYREFPRTRNGKVLRKHMLAELSPAQPS